MSKYLLAICYPDCFPEIVSTAARSIEEAEDRFMHSISEDFDFTEINFALANIYERTNRKQQAI